MHGYTQKTFPRAGVAFVDVHRALGAVAAGDQEAVTRIAAELDERAASGRSPAGEVVPQLARGLAAYGMDDWPGAVAALEAALAGTVRIGGSRAQRDLIRNTLIAAYIRADRAADARALVAGQKPERRPSVPVAGFA